MNKENFLCHICKLSNVPKNLLFIIKEIAKGMGYIAIFLAFIGGSLLITMGIIYIVSYTVSKHPWLWAVYAVLILLAIAIIMSYLDTKSVDGPQSMQENNKEPIILTACDAETTKEFVAWQEFFAAANKIES